MSKLKVGDRVVFVEDDYDGRVSCGDRGVVEWAGSGWDESVSPLVRVKFDTGAVTAMFESRLKKEKEMKYKVGDELEGEYSWTRTVVNIFSYNNKEYFVTEDSYDGCFNVETLAQLKEDWALKTDVKELTLDEIAKKFGVDVSKIRIKD